MLLVVVVVVSRRQSVYESKRGRSARRSAYAVSKSVFSNGRETKVS
jgi:hypothetical protein